jgi:NTE family protein
MLGAAGRNIEIMIDANELQSIKAADILVSADLKGFSSKNFNKAEEIAPRGYDAAKQKEALLSKFSVGQEEWNRYVAERSAKRRTNIPTPTFVTVVGRGAEKDEDIREAMGQLVGEPLEPQNLERELSRLMGLGYFNSLNYSLIDRNGQPGLVIRTTEKPYSPPFLNVGVVIDGSDTNNVGFGLAGRITLQNVGSFRSEWRTDLLFGSRYGIASEYYHPLNANTRWFVAPKALNTAREEPGSGSISDIRLVLDQKSASENNMHGTDTGCKRVSR